MNMYLQILILYKNTQPDFQFPRGKYIQIKFTLSQIIIKIRKINYIKHITETTDCDDEYDDLVHIDTLRNISTTVGFYFSDF